MFAQGWGVTESGSDSLILKQTLLPLVDRSLCRQKFLTQGETVADGMLCAGFTSGNFDSCQGDSGGPLVYRPEQQNPVSIESDEPVLVGVISWGIGCGNADLFGVYTSTAYYRSWMEGRIATFLETGK